MKHAHILSKTLLLGLAFTSSQLSFAQPPVKPSTQSFFKPLPSLVDTMKAEFDANVNACIPKIIQFKNSMSIEDHQRKKYEATGHWNWVLDASVYGLKCQSPDNTEAYKSQVAANTIKHFLKYLNSSDREIMEFLLIGDRMEKALQFYGGIAKKELLIHGLEMGVSKLGHLGLISSGTAHGVERLISRLGGAALVWTLSLELRGDTPIHQKIYKTGMSGELKDHPKSLMVRYNEEVLARLSKFFDANAKGMNSKLATIEKFFTAPIANQADAKEICQELHGFEGSWIKECAVSFAQWLELPLNTMTLAEKKSLIQVPDNTSKAMPGQTTTGGW